MKKIEPSNNADGFLEAIDSHKGIIYKIANSYCRDDEDRKDLIQEIIAQLWRSRDKYDDSYAMSTWVYRVALNVSISAYRKSSRRKETAFPAEAIERVAGEQLPADNKHNSDDVRLLHRFIGQLRELDRALILLYLDEKSHNEMSAILGLSTTNVATKLHRIKRRLRSAFERESMNHE